MSDSKQYRIAVSADSSGSFAGNGIRFNTPELAREDAADLASRWYLVRAYTVIPAELAPDVGGSYWSPELVKREAIGGIVQC